MNSKEKAIIEKIINSLEELLQGKIPAHLSQTGLKELDNLIDLVNELISSFAEIHEFILPLSRGVLNLEPPQTKNLMASSFKELHSQLKTLTWQVQQIAKGDYNQRVSFMGDFSTAFNNLVETLAEKDRQVKEQITLLEQEAARLKENEARYSLALEHSPGGVFILDPSSKQVLEFNIQFETILGYDEEDIAQMTFYDFYVDRSLADEDFQNSMKKSFYTVKSRQLKKKDGNIIEADIHTCWLVGTKSSVIIVNILDVTKRNQAEQVLNKFKILLEEAKDIIIFSDEEGKIIEVNKAAERAYGYSSEELQQMNIFDFFVSPNKSVLKIKIKDAYSNGNVFEGICTGKNNNTFPVEVSARGAVIGNKKILVKIIRDITERKRIEDELRYLATHDALTRISNRYALEEAIANIITNKNKGALLLLDVDNIKLINDTLGHAAGDKLLINLASLIKKQLGKNDVLARVGGDEFAILLSGVGEKEARDYAEKLRQIVETEIIHPSQTIGSKSFTVSIGVTFIDNHLLNVNEIMAQANFALYQAKEQGRNQVVCITCGRKSREKFKETNKIIRLMTSNDLAKRFKLYFQPVLNLETGEITHHEGLLRMFDDSNQLILPGKFISIAERFGLMTVIDRQVVKLAFEALKKYPYLKLFINLSGASLGDESLFNYIKENILESGLDPSRIGFEITETAAVKDLPKADRWISGLKELGCSFALDDFGIGFSTFSYLEYLPVDYVKIDGSYVRELDRSEKHRALVQAINTVAVSLGKTTIAEFVESRSIIETLKELNIKHGQGYFIGQPEPIPVSNVILDMEEKEQISSLQG